MTRNVERSGFARMVKEMVHKLEDQRLWVNKNDGAVQADLFHRYPNLPIRFPNPPIVRFVPFVLTIWS